LQDSVAIFQRTTRGLCPCFVLKCESSMTLRMRRVRLLRGDALCHSCYLRAFSGCAGIGKWTPVEADESESMRNESVDCRTLTVVLRLRLRSTSCMTVSCSCSACVGAAPRAVASARRRRRRYPSVLTARRCCRSR